MTDATRALLLELVRADGTGPARVPGDAWLPLVRLGEAQDMLGLLALGIARRGLEPPSIPRGAFEEALRTIRRHHAFHFIEAERVHEALEARGVRALPIKGLALARLAYGDPAERAFRDVDLLLAPDDVERAEDALARLGYRDAHEPAVRRAYREHHFHIVLCGPGRPFVEVHWGVTRPDEPYGIATDDLLHGAFTDGKAALHPDAHVLIAAASSMRDGFRALKPLVDIDRLVRSGAPIRWPRVVELARGGGMERILRATLELTTTLLRTPLETPLAALAPLGAAGARLREIGFEALPLGDSTEHDTLCHRLAQFWLTPDKPRALRNFVQRNAFERAQLRASGVNAPRRALGVAKRLAMLASLSARQLEGVLSRRTR